MEAENTLEILMDADSVGKVLGEYHRSRARCSFIMGPLGSAKTFETCQKILNLMIEQEPNAEGVRPSRWFAIRNTYPDLETTTIMDWLSLWGELGHFSNGSPPVHHINFGLEDGTTVDSRMTFLALDRPDAIKKLRGTQATGFWLNETKELPKAVIDMADLRHGRYPTIADGGVKCGWHGMVGDTNAPDNDHWYYELAEEQETPGWEFFKQPGGLLKSGEEFIPNPDAENLANLPDGYYEKGQVGKSRDWILVNLCNEYGFVSDGKPIYPEYADSQHALDREPELIRSQKGKPVTITVGVDFGRTPAAVFCQQTAMGQWQVLSELVTFDMGAVRFGDLMLTHMQKHYSHAKFEIWGDPAGDDMTQVDDKTPIKVLRAAGVPCLPGPTNDPVLRREAVVKPLTTLLMNGEPGLVISPACRYLRKGMQGGYKYRRLMVVGEERYQDKPDKNRYSHVCEALQYAMTGAGEHKPLIKPKSSGRPIKRKSTFRGR